MWFLWLGVGLAVGAAIGLLIGCMMNQSSYDELAVAYMTLKEEYGRGK